MVRKPKQSFSSNFTKNSLESRRNDDMGSELEQTDCPHLRARKGVAAPIKRELKKRKREEIIERTTTIL